MPSFWVVLLIMTLSIEESKKYLGEIELSDERIEEIRDLIYSFCESALDKHFFSGSVVTNSNHYEQNTNIVQESG